MKTGAGFGGGWLRLLLPLIQTSDARYLIFSDFAVSCVSDNIDACVDSMTLVLAHLLTPLNLFGLENTPQH